MGKPRRRHRLGALAALVAVGVLIASVVTDVQAHTRSRQEHQLLAAATSDLVRARGALAAANGSRQLAVKHRSTLLLEDGFTLQVLAAANTSLAGTTQAAYLQGLDIGTLQTCLGGVNGALTDISNRNNGRVGGDLTAVSAACLTLAGGNTSGLVYPFDFPDPYVLPVGGTTYAYATNSAEGNIQIIASTDLVHWNPVGNALPRLPAWAAPNATWAPSVLPIGGQYVLYYSAVVPNGGEQCISAATAAQPQGPFVDTSTAPMACQANLGGSIDPSPFVDINGTPYLEWKTIGANGQPPTIWSQQLDPAGTGLVGSGAVPLLSPGQSWEGGVVEAPDLVAVAGRYFLFYSGNNWNSANYAVGVATCTGPLGPCTKPLAQPILASGSGVAGPGGASVFADSSGTLWIAFHAWAAGAVAYPHSRDLYLRRLSFAGPMPSVEPAG